MWQLIKNENGCSRIMATGTFWRLQKIKIEMKWTGSEYQLCKIEKL